MSAALPEGRGAVAGADAAHAEGPAPLAAGAGVRRFLLRYDPPGLGVEVDNLGEVVIRHIDCPASSEVKSSRDIRRLVEDIIGKYPMLLSRRRHNGALVKLLGRLYSIEIEPDEAKVPKTSSDRRADNDSEFRPEPGQQVVVTKQTGDLQVHNGEVGTLIKVKLDKDKYEISIGDGQTILKLKGIESLFACAPGIGFNPGAPVVIRKLRNHMELNGCLGHIVSGHANDQRFEVRAVESRQLFRVKRENLVAVSVEGRGIPPHKEESPATAAASSPRAARASGPPAGPVAAGVAAARAAGAPEKQASPQHGLAAERDTAFAREGATITLHGLKTAAEFNGMTAIVKSVDRTRGRYEIRLEDGSVKTVRADNVKICG